MSVIDLDKLIEKNTKKFILKNQEYEIRPISYRQTIEMSKLEETIDVEESPEKILNFQIEYIRLVIPEISNEVLMDTMMPQIKKIQELIREVLSGEGPNDELVYYRDKYKDEYQKNVERAGEKNE